ncbi:MULTISPECIES: phosphoribosylformylglycinamidine synthase subunit PurS [Campylobacter]|uniref:Phosphoribosylformylglycinamidine synthase subunit PurS n=1 Tax=Campylobacter curvus (strain 525.92) TaxID=360105 RepID=A7GYK8_CAMC5|nr:MULTISPECIES: phosphoribosylformylglycinamidine synthase subunit PurS [Campylobacter]EAU00526.1 phosphoribosylformylglycinamidine synthase PurLQS, PurS subunit [Campylobacter curvus 525.92]MBN7288521.1 phosphoribosylformylglycinamidine synthase subunit PurS [Campylobacter curvus]MDU6827270.1 phosphoribosylformylglycinamidine synthase subunit PurS [Campylobacter sp.]QKF61294.1 phosphoribosylformylglycinamidine synthase PurLQS, PurS subunit [Campylobacter curvus]UEB49607.1 phosphoribosylformy
MKAVVNIALRNGVLDPAGKAVEHALNSLGFNNASNVRIGKQIVLDIEAKDKEEARAQLKTMCEELLANPVIEDYEIVL